MLDYQTSPKVRVDLVKILDDEWKQVKDDFGRNMYTWTLVINGVKKEIFFWANEKSEKKQFSNGDEYLEAWRIALEWYQDAIVIERSWTSNWKAWNMLTANIVREESETKAKVVINKNSWWYMQFSKDPAKRWGFTYSVTFQYDEDWWKQVFAWVTEAQAEEPNDSQLPF